MNTAVMACKKPEWHSTADCEDLGETNTRRFRKLKSDQFNTHGCEAPAAQMKMSDIARQELFGTQVDFSSMKRNASVLPLFRIPPEIRVWIHKPCLAVKTYGSGMTLPR